MAGPSGGGMALLFVAFVAGVAGARICTKQDELFPPADAPHAAAVAFEGGSRKLQMANQTTCMRQRFLELFLAGRGCIAGTSTGTMLPAMQRSSTLAWLAGR